MANQHPDAEAARDLKALPADLQALYQRLSEDGHVWQAASAERLATLAESLVADIERMVGDGSVARDDATGMSDSTTPAALPAHPLVAHPAHQHRREWVAGTVAAVAVVALLALVLQSALIGRGTTRPSNMAAGHWQVLDKLTWRRISSGQMLPAIAPSNPQVVYEAVNPVRPQRGYPGTSAKPSSLRRTDDGGKSWHGLSLPLPDARISSFAIRVSPLQPQTVFLSVWDLSRDACGLYDGVAGMECQRGYVSTDGGATWQSQKLPVLGVLDTFANLAAQGSRLYASTTCNGDGCARLLRSDNGGLAWSAVDVGIVASKQHLCDFAATASDQTVYVAASRASCAQAPTATRLWRSDDAGVHWTDLGPLQADIRDDQIYPNGTLLPVPGARDSNLLYRNEAVLTANSGLQFRYSQDKGASWKSTPTVPVASGILSDTAQVQYVGSAAVLSDGSLLYVQNDPIGGRATPYVWTPGASAWRRLPQLPTEVAGPGSIIVTPGTDGHDTITMALRANGDASNPVAYYVVRYQM